VKLIQYKMARAGSIPTRQQINDHPLFQQPWMSIFPIDFLHIQNSWI